MRTSRGMGSTPRVGEDPVAAGRDPGRRGTRQRPLGGAVHAPMACGGEANGERLLSPKTIEVVFDEQCYGTDLVLGVTLRHGIGFGLP